METKFQKLLDAKAKEAGYDNWHEVTHPIVSHETLNKIITAAAEEYKEQGKWISVQHEIPNSETVVLVICIITESPFMFRTLAYIDADGRWWKGAKQLLNVSHWMQLPELPNKA